jgi:hypothetical protein
MSPKCVAVVAAAETENYFGEKGAFAFMKTNLREPARAPIFPESVAAGT